MLAHAFRPVSHRFRRPAVRLIATGFFISTLVSGCDKVALLAPSGTAITLFPSGTAVVVPLGGSLSIVADVIENGGTSGTGSSSGGSSGSSSAGTPVQNGTAVTFTTTLGHFQSSQATTTNGQATVTLFGDSTSGKAVIFAFSGGAKSAELDVQVGATVNDVSVTATPSSLPATGGTSVVSARVEDINGNGLVGMTVLFTTDAGNLSPTSATTDSTGRAQSTLTTTTTANVTATSGGKASTAAKIPVTVHSTITLTPPTSSAVSTPATFAATPAAATGASITDVSINFGDGSVRSLGAVTSGSAASTVHLYATAGQFNVSATVTDSTGATTTVSTTIAVSPLGLTISPTPTSPVHGTPASFTVTLTPIIAASGASIDHYEWDFGDGTTATSSGTTTNHVYAAAGTYNVTATAVPTVGSSVIATFQILVT